MNVGPGDDVSVRLGVEEVLNRIHMAKGAVVALTRALAVDHVSDGIRVNAVCPGTVDSPWVRRLVEEAGESLDALRERQPMGRLGTPNEIADAVAYLASDAAGFVTGSVLVIDGGLTAA